MNRHLPTLPERVFLCVGSVITLTLLVKATMQASVVVICVGVAAVIWLAGYWFAVRRTEPNGVARMITNFVTVWLLYSGSGRIINAIQRPDCGETLLAWDRQLFGKSSGKDTQIPAAGIKKYSENPSPNAMNSGRVKNTRSFGGNQIVCRRNQNRYT